MYYVKIYISLLIFILVVSCAKNKGYNTYEETAVKEESSAACCPEEHSTDTSDSTSFHSSDNHDSSVTWKVPESWSETPASGMRMGSFVTAADLVCTIIALGGDSGTLEANIERWAGQIGLQLTEEKLKSFTSSIDKQGEKYKYQLIDFSQFTEKDKNSMLVAIFEISEKKIYIKLSGIHQKIIKDSKAFKELCDSIKY